MADIPYNEPASFRAGDTVTWKKTSSDYPAADGWTLKYSLRNASQKIDITASVSGTDFLITVASVVSSGYVAGRYDWIGYVTKGDEKYTIAQGSIDILPDLSADVAYDARSDARKIYDELITAYKSYISGGQGHLVEIQIAGRMMKFRNTADFITQIQYWAKQVRAEDDAAAVAKGLGNPRRVGIRLNRA